MAPTIQLLLKKVIEPAVEEWLHNSGSPPDRHSLATMQSVNKVLAYITDDEDGVHVAFEVSDDDDEQPSTDIAEVQIRFDEAEWSAFKAYIDAHFRLLRWREEDGETTRHLQRKGLLSDRRSQ